MRSSVIGSWFLKTNDVPRLSFYPHFLPLPSLPFFNSLLALARAAFQSGIMDKAEEKVMTSTEPAGGRPAAFSSQASATIT